MCILSRDNQGIARDVPGRNRAVPKVECECDSNATAARSNVEHTQRFGRLKGTIGLVVGRNDLFAKHFCFGTWDKYTWSNHVITATKAGFSHDILHRFACFQPLDQRFHAHFLLVSEAVKSVGIEIGQREMEPLFQ